MNITYALDWISARAKSTELRDISATFTDDDRQRDLAQCTEAAAELRSMARLLGVQ
jgi:hypothetical protein